MFLHPDLGVEPVVVALEQGGFEASPPVALRRTLLDTFDGRLHAAGLRLELREASGNTLVLTGGGPAPAHVPVALTPRSASDLPAGPLRARLAPVLDVRALLAVVSVTARQRVAVRRDRLGKVVTTATVYDHVAIGEEPGAVPGPGWAVEVDELAGYAKAAQRARNLLGSLGLQPVQSDLMGLAADAGGVDLRGHIASPTVVLDRAEPALEAFRRVLANLADEIDANWEGTVGHVDAEFLHDLRVAVRRTRSVLAQSKRVLPAGVRNRFREEFGWLGAATGPARDLDVYVIEWDSYVTPLGPHITAALAPLVRHLADRRETEHALLADLLGSARYHDLLAAWQLWLRAPTDTQDSDSQDAAAGADASKPIGKVAARRIAVASDNLVARGRGIGPDTPADELHELRKDAKKLRYLLECFGALLPPGERKAFVQRLKALQDNLGEHQDTEVHAAQLRAMSHELHDSGKAGAETLVAMGQLAGEFERRRIEARTEFAERFAAYDTAKTRSTLATLLESAASRGPAS
ncbi:MAG: CHAD domain-containing protein [Acidimicrobiales bacterium]